MYPNPILSIVIEVPLPPTIFAVASANVETPTCAYSFLTVVPIPTPTGASIYSLTAEPT